MRYPYHGPMDEFQMQLASHGISKEEFNLDYYKGCYTKKQLQKMVDEKIREVEDERRARNSIFR